MYRVLTNITEYAFDTIEQLSEFYKNTTEEVFVVRVKEGTK